MPIPIVELIVVLPDHKRALADGRDTLAAYLGLSLPDDWPEFPEAFELHSTDSVETPRWPGYFFVSKFHQSVVGNGGFAGQPQDGEIEIGYEIAPAFRNQGFATAAVEAMLAVAFSQPEILAVTAHTLATENPSNGVLKKVGMRFVGEFPNDDVGTVWRWRKARQ
jgi:RimJ/RimL family protein N-acetyltransferase